MWSFVIAVAVLMWMWTAASLYLLRALLGSKPEPVRLAGLVAVTGLGMIACLCLPYLVLPGSALSLTWTREMLSGAQQYSVLLVLLVAAAGFLRVQSLLLPALPARPATAQKKRRP